MKNKIHILGISEFLTPVGIREFAVAETFYINEKGYDLVEIPLHLIDEKEVERIKKAYEENKWIDVDLKKIKAWFFGKKAECGEEGTYYNSIADICYKT